MELTRTYPITPVCQALGVSRSSYYYHPRQVDESQLKAAIKEIAGQFVTYGNRRITAQLNRHGYRVGRQRVRRLMKALNIRGKGNKPKICTTRSESKLHPTENLLIGLDIIRPDQVWVSDITLCVSPHGSGIPGDSDGCVYPNYPGMASESKYRPSPDPYCATQSSEERKLPGNSPL